MILEIQGTQHRLTGTADAQYEEWRQLLRQIFIAESGFVPEEVAIYAEPEPEPEAPIELPPVPELPTELPADAAEAEGQATTEAADADPSAVDGV